MTPSEKKARADIVSEIIHESKKYEDGFISSDQFSGFLNESLDAAERRGFERAKRMVLNSWPSYILYEERSAIENLKYEEPMSDKPEVTSESKFHWRIYISEWGTLWGFGTEKQAEEWRRHKCRWEHCIGNKRVATTNEVNENKFEDLERLLS